MYLHWLAALIAAASATPQLKRTLSPFCHDVNALVTIVMEQTQATAFCSSYLSIPIATTTTTATDVVVLTSTVTSIVGTSTITASPVELDQTSNVPVVLTITNTVVVSTTIGTSTSTVTQPVPAICSALPANVKRAIIARKPMPSCFNKYSGTRLISSACSCLSVPTSTKTSTAYATTSNTTYPVLSVTATATTTPTSTSVITIFNTQTTIVDMTVHQTVTPEPATVTKTGPFFVQASGGGATGDYARFKGEEYGPYEHFDAGVTGADQFFIAPGNQLVNSGGSNLYTLCGSVGDVTDYSTCGIVSCSLRTDCTLDCGDSFLGTDPESFQDSGSNYCAIGENYFGGAPFTPYAVAV